MDVASRRIGEEIPDEVYEEMLALFKLRKSPRGVRANLPDYASQRLQVIVYFLRYGPWP